MHTKQVQEFNVPRLHYKTVSDLVGALRQCSKTRDLEQGKELHLDAVEANCHTDKYVASSLIRMYMKCGDTQHAQEVFDGMLHRDIVTWNSLIMGYVENGESSMAMHFFTVMDFEPDSYTYVAVLKACACLATEGGSALLEKGIPIHRQVRERGLDGNIVVSNTLIDMYSKCGSMHHAREVFERMLHKDVVSWTCLILGYVENGKSSVGIELFDKMDVEPDSFTHAAALKAYARLASEKHAHKDLFLEKGKAIHRRTKERGFDSNIIVATALVDMYSKCGCMEHAREVFDRVKSPNVIMWNCLMMGYLENGKSSVALEIFARMNTEPDHGTYVAALTACGNLASLSAGEVFHSEVCKLGLELEQVMGTTLVDFYGKCGSMAKSEMLFDSMCSPNIVSWTALIQGYAALGECSHVFSLVKNVQTEGLRLDNITHRCILNVCSHSGMVDEGKSYFRSIIEPTVEHYTCVIDMLGRANRLEEALCVAKSMPYEGDAVMWTSFLAACRKFKNVQVGKAVYDELVASGSANAAVYVLMRDIYAQTEASSTV